MPAPRRRFVCGPSSQGRAAVSAYNARFPGVGRWAPVALRVDRSPVAVCSSYCRLSHGRVAASGGWPGRRYLMAVRPPEPPAVALHPARVARHTPRSRALLRMGLVHDFGREFGSIRSRSFKPRALRRARAAASYGPAFAKAERMACNARPSGTCRGTSRTKPCWIESRTNASSLWRARVSRS